MLCTIALRRGPQSTRPFWSLPGEEQIRQAWANACFFPPSNPWHVSSLLCLMNFLQEINIWSGTRQISLSLQLVLSLFLSLLFRSFPQITLRRRPGHPRPLKHTSSSSSLKVSMSYRPAPSHTRGYATPNLANAAIFTLPTLPTPVKSLNCIDANEMKLRSKTSDQSDLIHLLCIHP